MTGSISGEAPTLALPVPAVQPEPETRTVFYLEKSGRTVYCSSVSCVFALTTQGWKLSDPAQLSILVRELAKGRGVPASHLPSDHF